MDLDHVRSLVAVVDEGGFRRAAQALGLSQPTVSRHVLQVEAALGSTVLHRGPHGVELTRAGTLFLTYARSLLAAEAEVRRLVAWRAHLDPGERTTCRIGVVEGSAAGLTAPLLRGLSQRHPGVTFDFVPLTLAGFTGLVPPDLDLVLGRDPWREDEVQRTVLFEDPLVLVVAPHHPLAGSGSVPLERALEETLMGVAGHVWEPMARYWTLADHGDPRLGEAGTSPVANAEIFRRTGTAGVAPLTAMSVLRGATGPCDTVTIEGLPPNRSCLASRAGDSRRLVREVHRCARRLAEELVPLLLPPEVRLPSVVGPRA